MKSQVKIVCSTPREEVKLGSAPAGSISRTAEMEQVGGRFVYIPELKGTSPPELRRTDELDPAPTPTHLAPKAIQNLLFGKAARPRGMSALPPVRELAVRVNHVYRFLATSASQLSVNATEIFGAIGGICTVSNSTVTSLASSFRIKSLTVWPSASTSAATSMQLAWGAGTSGQVPDSVINRDIPQGTTLTGGVVFRPPPKSLAQDWVDTSVTTAQIMLLQVPVGSVLDLSIEYTLLNQFAKVNNAVTTATLEAMYYLALDGPSSNTLQPVGVPTTH